LNKNCHHRSRLETEATINRRQWQWQQAATVVAPSEQRRGDGIRGDGISEEQWQHHQQMAASAFVGKRAVGGDDVVIVDEKMKDYYQAMP